MSTESTKKVKDLSIKEFRDLIHEVVAEDLELWRETFEIMADKKLMKKLEKADKDWVEKGEAAYLEWSGKKAHVSSKGTPPIPLFPKEGASGNPSHSHLVARGHLSHPLL